VDLLAEMKVGSMEFRTDALTPSIGIPAKALFARVDGNLKVDHRAYAQMSTTRSFGDGHLVFEFKWGDKTYGPRETKARDAAILLTAGTSGDSAGISVSLREGCLGDLSLYSAENEPLGKPRPFLESEVTTDGVGQHIWKPGASLVRVTAGAVHWARHDSGWVDRKGFRGRNDVESPASEWNRLEVIIIGKKIKCVVNGVSVNEVLLTEATHRKLSLQCRGAELTARRYEMYPVGVFKESWSSIQASGGTDVSVRDGQTRALSPEESLKQIQLDGPYDAQLVAAEPLVLDPVECTWDAKGRMYVADMLDYPLGPKNPGDPWLSRIQMLTDEDGDGRMDKAVTFAAHLDHVQGLLPYKDGLIVTTRTQILFLRDTDGDGVADVNEPLITGFNPRFSQLQVSAPRWGPDGFVYFNNGLDAKEIYAVDQPNAAIGVPRTNFRWDPRSGKLEPVTGFGQYGASFDDFGRYFFCSNRNPVMFAVMPFQAVLRNPLAGIEKGWEDIAPAGPETRVYPLRITHTTADAHAGTNTACSGLGVYRGHLMPELKNNVFVPEPTGQLVTRYRVEPNGASLRAIRVGEHKEFFRSGDEWCRPVNFTTGPDGAIYICDMYRRWIDHARFFPEDYVKSHDMREGEAQGRIWRIVPKGMKLAPVERTPESVVGLRKWLEHPNAWQRETARRLLAEKGELWTKEEQVETRERQTFLSIIDNLSVGPKHTNMPVTEHARALSNYPEDPWIAKAVLSASRVSAGAVLVQILADNSFSKTYSAQRASTVQGLARLSAAGGEENDFGKALSFLTADPFVLSWWKAAVIQGFSEGISKVPSHPWGKSLAELAAKSGTPFYEAAQKMGVLVARMETALSDAGTSPELKLACLSLLEQRKWEDVQTVVKKLLMPGQDPGLQAAAMNLVKRFGADKAGPLAYELLPISGPALRRELVSLLSASPKTALELFKRMERGEISPALVEIETRWRYQRGQGELRDLAVKLFGQPSEDRAGVVKAYAQTLDRTGNVEKGRQLFESMCTSCHRYGGMGSEVGPSLSDVKVKPPEALLSDILDPNRMFEARYCAYQVDMRDGRILVGIVSGETSDSVTLTLQGGLKETLPRSAMREMKSLDRSLMPPGMEALITLEQMPDLLSFLRQP
jgi:putative membrane-bound dehydrogenase-like protein